MLKSLSILGYIVRIMLCQGGETMRVSQRTDSTGLVQHLYMLVFRFESDLESEYLVHTTLYC